MPKPILPAEPVDRYVLKLWQVTDWGVRALEWSFHFNSPCHEVVPYCKPGEGVPYRFEWYTDSGRFEGWELTGDGEDPYWRNIFESEQDAQAAYSIRLLDRIQYQQEILRELEEQLAKTLERMDEL